MVSSVRRSVAKAFTWKLISFLIILLLSGDIELSVAYLVVTVVLYVFHERLWKRSRWGKFYE